jgi:hypothetical protein
MIDAFAHECCEGLICSCFFFFFFLLESVAPVIKLLLLLEKVHSSLTSRNMTTMPSCAPTDNKLALVVVVDEPPAMGDWVIAWRGHTRPRRLNTLKYDAAGKENMAGGSSSCQAAASEICTGFISQSLLTCL